MDDKTSAYMETNIASQDNSATPLLNFRASQMKAAHSSDDGIQLDVEGSGGQLSALQTFLMCHSANVFWLVLACKPNLWPVVGIVQVNTVFNCSTINHLREKKKNSRGEKICLNPLF